MERYTTVVNDLNWKFAETEMNLNFGSIISLPKPKPKFRKKCTKIETYSQFHQHYTHE